MLLSEIRGECISYTSRKKKENTRLEHEILFDMKRLEEHLTESNLKVLEHKREESFELRQKKLDGITVRSCTKRLFEGERNTKYFCNPEKRNCLQKVY